MDWHEYINIDPGIQGGTPVVKGTRVAVQILVGSLAGGMTIEEISEEYGVTEDHVRAALAYAADTIANERAMAL